tara:strand:+ start:903 stop:1184 length:282 start_codon:yes stop_codon:yes gene_type:complete
MTDTNKTNNEWSEREIGALWKREGRNQKYLTGKVKDSEGNEQQVVIFSNKNKTKDNQPDFRVYKSVDRSAVAEETVSDSSPDEASDKEQEDLL